MPHPMTTACAWRGRLLLMRLLIYQKYTRLRERVESRSRSRDVTAHRLLGTVAVPVTDRDEQLPMLPDRILETGDPLECQEPDPEA